MGSKGHQPDEEGGPGHDLVERGGPGGTVGPAPAQEVTGRQVEQDQPDDGGPHQVGSAKVGTQQAGGRQFDRQRDQSAGEGGDVEVGSVPFAHTGRLYPLWTTRQGAPFILHFVIDICLHPSIIRIASTTALFISMAIPQ